jgi:hypothetical protein
MDKSVSIWEKPEIGDRLDEIIRADDNLDLVLAQIPSLFGDSDKATYLGFRALGLRPKQALELLDLPIGILEVWKEETPQFEEFEYKCLTELQKNINADIIRLQFLRNMTMFLFRDSLTIRRSLTDFESMSNREAAYLRSVRRFYSNSDLLALEKAIAPEKHRNNTLVLSFGNNVFQVEDSEDGEPPRMIEVGDD